MSLSSMTPLVGTSQTVFNRQQQQPAPTPQPLVPGTREFAAQYQQTSPRQSSQEPGLDDNLDDLDTELEQFKAKDDNGGDGGSQGKPTGTQEPQLPKPEDFDKVASGLAQRVQLNPEQVQQALGGNVEAFNGVLNSMMKQVIQQTLYAGLAANNEFGKAHRTVQTQQIQQELTSKQQMSATVDAAVKLNPSLGAGLQRKLLETAIADLRSEYPGAPVELLAKKAARLLGGTGKPAAPQSQGGETDWTSIF